MDDTDCIQIPLSTRRTTPSNPLKQLKSRQPQEIQTEMENIDDNYIILTSPRQSKQILFGSQRNLNLSNKQLSTIPEDKILSQNIQKLDLSGNSLQLYQDHFKSLQLILYLNLSHNYLVSLPDNFNIFHPLLQIIDLSYNYFTHLDKLPQQIQQLYVQYNYLHLFPNNLPKTLKILHIQGNPIQSMEYVSSLTELGLDWLKLIGWPQIIQSNLLQNMQEWLQNSKHRSIKQFISHFTSDNFDYLQIDTLGRNIIHQAAINDDLGILIGMHNTHTINGLDYNFQTPLQLAIKSQNPKCSKLLIKLGANLKNQNLIVLAISKNLLNILKILLNNDLSPNESDIEGDTPLHYLMSKWSCIPNNVIYARLLLKYGACTNLLNNSGFSPLQMSIRRSQVEAVIFALDYKPLIKNYDLCYHTFNEDQRSSKNNYDSFELAIQFNCPEIIQILLQRKQQIIQLKQDCLNHYCVSKLINKRNKEIIEQYSQYQYQQYQQLKEQQQFSCIFMNQSQIHSTKIKINEPNNFQMSTSSQYYFKHHESIKLKIGDQEQIDISDSSIDSKEEQKHSHNTINYTENIKIAKTEMGVPKLTSILNPVLSKHLDAKTKNYVKLKSMADSYYNEFVMCEQVERQAHILSMLIKLDLQISHTHRNIREQYVKTIIKTIYLEINQLASVQEIESSIEDEQNQIQIRQFNFMKQELDQDDQEDYSYSSLLIVNSLFIKGQLIIIILLIYLFIIYIGIYDKISHIRERINQTKKRFNLTSLI